MVKFGYQQSHANHTIFIKQESGKISILIVYVDDIILTNDDVEEVAKLKAHLAKEFDIKDLGRLRYFLGIEVVRSNKDIFIS